MNMVNDAIPMSEANFRMKHNFRLPEKESLWKKAKSHIRIQDLSPLRFFPIFTWIRKYNIKEDLRGDIIAGLTCSVLQISHGLSFAPLAGQEPVVGLYLAVFPPLAYVLTGTSRHLSLGMFAVVMMMVGKVVSENASEDGYSALEISIAVTFLTGSCQLLCGFLRLGFLCVLLSPSLMSGFTCAAAVHVGVLQIKYIMGISAKSIDGPLKLVYTVMEYVQHAPETNLVALSMSCAVIALLCIYDVYFQRKFAKKTKIPIPAEFLVICAATVVTYLMELNSKYDVAVVGELPPGLPTLTVPHFIPSLLFDCLVIALVNCAVNISFGSVFAKKGGYTMDCNQELLAYGATNMLGSFLLTVPACASISRTSVQYSVGGKTQLSTAFSSLIGLILLMFANKPLGLMPLCVLSSVILVGLKAVFTQLTDLPKIWRRGKLDAIIWMVTFLSVILIDISLGVSIALVVSLFIVIIRCVRTEILVLGRLPNEDTYVDTKYYETHSQVLILKIIGCINFVNRNSVFKKLKKEVMRFCALEKQTYSRCFILDLEAVSYVDVTAIDEFIDFYGEVKTLNCDVIVTNCNYSVYKTFEDCDLFLKFPKSNVIVDINEGVICLRPLGVL